MKETQAPEQRTYCPAKCGRLYLTKEQAYAHADKEHPNWNRLEMQKRKGWITPYGFADFRKPVTYEEACHAMKIIWENLIKTNEGK